MRFELGWLMRRCLGSYGFIVLFSVAVAALHLVVPIYMIQIFDRVLASHSYETLIALSLIAVFCLFFFAVFDAVRGLLATQAGTWFEETVLPYVFQASLRAQIAGDASAGNNARSDVRDIREFAGGQPLITVIDAIIAPIFLLIIYLMHPVLAAVAFAGIMGLVVLSVINELMVRNLQKSAVALGRVSETQLAGIIRNAETVQSLGLADNLFEANGKTRTMGADAANTMRVRAETFGSISKFLRLGVQIAMLAVGAALGIHVEITPGVMFAASILMSRALAPFERMIPVWKSSVSARQGYASLKAFLERYGQTVPHMSYPRPKGPLVLSGVTARVPGMNRNLFANLSLRIEGGEAIGIMGPSGCGKSTLARMMLGIAAPAGGSITLDGVEVSQWDRRDLGQHVGYLSQSVEILSGTIHENIARFDAEARDEEVVEAAQAAGIHEFVATLPQGYHTRVGEGGVRLSGGQLQRVGLARALFRSPSFIILDEPNSSLDTEGERALQEALAIMKAKGSLIAMVVHNPAVLGVVDKLLVFRDGQAIMGPKDAVLQKLHGDNVRRLDVRAPGTGAVN